METNKVLKVFIVLLLFSAADAQEEISPWFYFERALPNDSIPADSYKNALDQQLDMRRNVGYGISPQQAVWNSIGPEAGTRTGRVVRVKYHPTDGNIVYICGNNGGVWKSTNNGSNFVPMTDHDYIQTQCSGDIAIDPQDHNTLYWGTGGSIVEWPWYNYYGIGVYKSTDAGNSWSGPYRSGLPSLIFTSTIVVNSANRHVYLANCLGTGGFGNGWGDGLYKSTDGGVTWARVGLEYQSPDQEVWDVVVSDNGQYVHTVSSTGYWQSTDYGASFDWMDPEGTGRFQGGRTQIAISKTDPDFVYILVNSSWDLHLHAFASTNGGLTFPRYKHLSGPEYGLMPRDFMFVQASPINPLVAFAGYGGNYAPLWRTTDGGLNWIHVHSKIDMNNFAFNPINGNQAILCTDEGLYISNNIMHDGPVSFSSISYTLSLRQNYRVASNPYDEWDIVMAAQDAGFFKYRRDLGLRTWLETSTGGDGTAMVHSRGPVDAFDVFIGNKGISSALIGSTDGGNTWPRYSYLSWDCWDANEDWIAPIAEKPGAPGTFYCPRREKIGGSCQQFIDINVTTNYGLTWVQTPSPITKITSGDANWSPYSISFCDANPDIIYVSTRRWLNWQPPLSQVWRTTNGGQNWQNVLNGVTGRMITSVVADPVYPNNVYLTVSGFSNSSTGDVGHVFKSVDKGDHWFCIDRWPDNPTRGMPDLPANYMVIRYTETGQRLIIVATDAGIYQICEGGGCGVPTPGSWKEVASGLPNCPVLGLDFNLYSNKLRAALFGRGIWEVRLQGPIFIAGEQTLASPPEGINIADDIVIGSGSTLTIPYSCIIKIPAGKKIIVEDGGQIDASSGNPITITSQSGLWGGIEFQGLAYGNLTNITFDNTETPITVNGSASETPTSITIAGCTFKNGPVVLNNRRNITVNNCNWSYTTPTTVPSVFGVSAVGCENLYVISNVMNYNSSLAPSGAIFIDYCNNAVVQYNNINEGWNGIGFYNSSGFISTNNITTTTASHAMTAVGMTNVYSTTVEYNRIRGFQKAFYMNNSSPSMLGNDAVNTYSYGSSNTNAGLEAEYNSSPLLAPAGTGGLTINEAGENTLSQNLLGCGIIMKEQSIPVLDQGDNIIYVYNYYLFGYAGYPVQVYNVTYNCWVDNPPVEGKFDVPDIQEINYAPWNTCNLPGGGGYSSLELKVKSLNLVRKDSFGDVIPGLEEVPEDPPPSIIVSYGNVYDTIQVLAHSMNLPADRQLFSLGVKQTLEGQYQNAITTFKQVIQQYQDSLTAINSLKKIMYCYFRMNADTSAYSSLRNYYLNLVSLNQSDTSFVQVATELAAKTLVRRSLITNAIEEFEYVAMNSIDSAEVDNAELNIIQTYLLLSGGDANYSGSLTHLRPASLFDAIRMINDRLYRFESVPAKKLIPDNFHLSQNYPNPFNVSTKINYALPQSARVKLKVYDILGRQVKVLVNEYKEAGYHSITFDAEGFASGVYFYRIEAGSYIDSKKMVVLK